MLQPWLLLVDFFEVKPMLIISISVYDNYFRLSPQFFNIIQKVVLKSDDLINSLFKQFTLPRFVTQGQKRKEQF